MLDEDERDEEDDDGIGGVETLAKGGIELSIPWIDADGPAIG